MKKILTVVGARPQFIKAAVLSRLIRSEKWKAHFSEILLHTGQHYDENMSDIFFREMQIPQPDIHLQIGGSTHGAMTGQMLIEIEQVLLKEKPDLVLVYGDTNSTLAGALAASKLHLPVAHIEAGLRSFNMRMPEEQNRILTDHLSSYLFCPTDLAVRNLNNEGINKCVHQFGDIMFDATIYYQNLINQQVTNGLMQYDFPEISDKFYLATIHRAENTDDKNRLSNIISALNSLPYPVVLPLHPRTRNKIHDFNIQIGRAIQVINPVGYLEMIQLESRALAIITDSGGVQKEAYFMGKPCITLRDETEWVETVESGWNTIVGADFDVIKEVCQNLKYPSTQPQLYGDGNSAERMLKVLAQ